MPNIKSAAKRVKVNQKRRLRNARIKSTVRTTIRRFNDALGAAGREDVQAKLRQALIILDKAVTKGVLHKNTAARTKSRLTKRFNKTAV